jgi:hypothetical protein
MDIDSDPIPVDESTPLVRNVHFSDITAREVESAGFFAGLPEQRFEGITFSNVDIDATRPLDATDLSPAMADNYDQQHGLFCKSIADITFDDVRIRTPDSPAMEFEDTGTVSIDGLRTPDDQDSPIVEAEDVDDLLVCGCDAPEGTFLKVRGDDSGRVSLAGNHGDLAGSVEVEADERLQL